jgi:hypothetical protein
MLQERAAAHLVIPHLVDDHLQRLVVLLHTPVQQYLHAQHTIITPPYELPVHVYHECLRTGLY